jgi:alkylation response protein AidB-like acyl-CoA dehydrogenase
LRFGVAVDIQDRARQVGMDIVGTPGMDDDVVGRVAALVPWMQQHAAQLDADAAFPTQEIAALHAAGALNVALPVAAGLSPTETSDRLPAERSAARAVRMAAILVQVGLGNLAVGRIVEAHINAHHLIARYGTLGQRIAAAKDADEGELFALWVTDPRANGLGMSVTSEGIRLTGGKMFCSAAGHATRAVVTAANEDGAAQMLVVSLGAGERVEPLAAPLQGMRAAVTWAVDFDGCVVSRDACLGKPGDYLREPDLSAGAWRGSAVALGGLCGIVALLQAQLEAAGQLDDPHNLQRLGGAMIAWETSRLWIQRVARVAEDPTGDPAKIVAYVGLARIAIETACLDAMRLAQRSLGLSAFRQGNPVERICRDLGTYLRQPAPDEVLTEAAAYFARRPCQWP